MNDMKPDPTFIYENDKTYIMIEGKVVGSFNDDALIEEEAERIINESATHIVTPNGLKGKVLGRVKGVWDDQVTVRFENGRIVQLPVSRVSFVHEAETNDEGDTVVNKLSDRLAASVDPDISALKDRIRELDKIKAEARHLIDNSNLSDEDLSRVGGMIVQANYQLDEINDVIRARHEALVESYEPPAPFKMEVVEQGGPSRGSLWLDAPLNEMIAEAAATDYEKLMDEGPEAFVVELDSSVLADSGATRAIASNWIRERTAAADDSVRDKYERVWLDRVEQVRRSALIDYKKNVTQKEAAQTKEIGDSPDEALFS